jgi:hypothetical protein
MFAVLHSDINSHKSGLLHLTGKPYWKKSRSAKVKDGIIAYFIGTISLIDTPGNTEGGSITVPLTFCLTGLESAVLHLTIFVFICKTD